MDKRHYSDFFTVPQDYKANMTREAINETPKTWLDFYPHAKYVEFLNTLIQEINGGSKSIWLTGNYGTGKSNAALVTQKLFMDDEDRVREWFVERCKDKLADPTTLLNKLFARRQDGTLVVYDYNASGVGPNEEFLVRLERVIVEALNDNGMTVPPKANLDEIIQRVDREARNGHFFEIRDTMLSELTYLNAEIKTIDQIVTELRKPHHHTDVPSGLLGDIQKVLHRDNIYLDVSVGTFRKWIKDILLANNIKYIVYIFDEFSEFIDSNKEHLKTFEEVTENPGINKFYLIPITHLSINAYMAEGSSSAKKAGDRFHFRNLQMPNDIAFELAYHAMKPNPELDIAEEWKNEKQKLWQAVRGIYDLHFNSNDQSSADYISKQSFYNILPIHPMAAFLLKFLAESARSNQRSIFEYLKGSADGQEFQDFIRTGGPAIQSKQFLTADYLWGYFIEREDLGLSKEIVAIRSEFERIKNREFQNKDDDDENIRVLKAILLFCLLSRLLTTEAHDRLKPTVENIKLAFQGDGAIVGIDTIIKSLEDKHCFSVVNGNIELFATSVGDADLQTKIAELENKFHELLSSKTEEILKKHKHNDIAKSFSTGRFDFRVSDIWHTTLANITSAKRDQYSSDQNKDTGAICLWFVVAKNKEEQLQVTEKIKNILIQFRDHRIMMFSFPKLTFCEANLEFWAEYIEQYAKYMLENDATVKEQCKKAYERLERDWFDRITNIGIQMNVYTNVNGQFTVEETRWNEFKETISDYVKQTLPCCVDTLTNQHTAFNTSGLKSWAEAGIQFDEALIKLRQLKQLVEAFKKQGVVADLDWFAQNDNHPIARIRTLFDDKIANTIGKGRTLSIRKVYIEFQRAPYGMKNNALSAFVLGIALRHILNKGYQWDNQQKTGTLDTENLAEIIESVVKDDGQDKIKAEKLICRLSREAKVFVEKAPMMFGITNAKMDVRIEDVLGQIQSNVEKVSERVPLWLLSEYVRSQNEPLAEVIADVLSNVCLALTTSSKGNTDERTNAINKIGSFILDNHDLVNIVASYIKPENFVTAFQKYVDENYPTLVVLANEIGDISHDYCRVVLDNAVETAGWLWNKMDISNEIDKTIQEYEVIKILKPILSSFTFVTYKEAFGTLREFVTVKNKLPKTLIEIAEPSISTLLFSISNNGTANDIRNGLEHNINIVKKLFFDVSKVMSIELLKQRINDVSVSDADLRKIYDDLPNGFLQNESNFLNDVHDKIEEFSKKSVALNIKAEWKRLSGADTPSVWANINHIPVRFALGNINNFSDIITAVEFPEKFSAEKLNELLNELRMLLLVDIANCQKLFIDDIVPKRFAKLNIGLPPLLDYLENKYGTQPNNWPSKPDINEFIKSQYKLTFAPQVAEKIKKISAEDLKNRLLRLVQDNPDVGLLFWE
jgi:hypothetical protein